MSLNLGGYDAQLPAPLVLFGGIKFSGVFIDYSLYLAYG